MNQKNIKISFPLTKLPAYVTAEDKGRPLFDCKADANSLVCQVYFDFSEKPLVLRAEVKQGDQVELLCMLQRIELHINGKLCDEEWPCGNRLFDSQSSYDTNLSVRIEDWEEPSEVFPNIIGTFQNAEGWKPEKNIFVGDCMPYVSQGRYHVLYLKDRHRHQSKWGLGAHQWAHISTNDFVHWEIHPLAVAITKPEEGSICTGSWIAHGGTEYLFYTVRTTDGSPASIRRSVSQDGFHFKKDDDFRLTLSEKYDESSARDPKVIRDENGQFHMILTTSLVKEERGCLAHLVSQDLNTWIEEENVLYLSPDSRQPECPDYICYHGRYYLLSSLNWNARYLYADKPFGPWKQPKDPIIPCKSVPKGAVWDGKIVFTGFESPDGAYGGTMTFTTATANDSGELVFHRGTKEL